MTQKKMQSGSISSQFLLENVGIQDPVFLKGEGAYLFDNNDNQYIDFYLNNGSFILGHSNWGVLQTIVDSMQQQQTFYPIASKTEELANNINQTISSADQLVFFDSYSAAVSTAIRLARSYAARRLIVMFSGAYHGANDELLTGAGAGVADLKHFTGPGVPDNIKEGVVVLPYNDIDAFQQLYTKKRNDIAAVIVEPILTSAGIIVSQKEFLQKIKNYTEEDYTVLIFDESRTAFRIPELFAQEVINIEPDLTILGNSLANGMPLAALAGRSGVMKMLRPKGSVYHDCSGSIGLSLSVAHYVWQTVNKAENIAKIKKTADSLNLELNSINNNDINVSVWGTMFSVAFNKGTHNTFDSMKMHKKAMYRKFYHHIFNNKLFLTPSYYSPAYLSTEHSHKDIAQLKEILEGFKVQNL